MPDEIEFRFKEDLIRGNGADAANVLHQELQHNPREAMKLIRESERMDREGVNIKDHGFPEHVAIHDDVVVGPQGQVGIRDKVTGREMLAGQMPREAFPPVAQPGVPPPGAYEAPPPQGNPNVGAEIAVTAAVAGLAGFLAGRGSAPGEVFVHSPHRHLPIRRHVEQ